MIDRTNHHLFQPLLYQVATGILSEGQIAPAIRDVLRRMRNLTVLLAEVCEIDVAKRQIRADEFGRSLTIDYDSLIIACGSTPSFFGHDEFRSYAHGHEDARRRPGSAGTASSAPSSWPRRNRTTRSARP